MRLIAFLLLLTSCTRMDIAITQGGKISSEQLAEKIVVLNVWAQTFKTTIFSASCSEDILPPCVIAISIRVQEVRSNKNAISLI